MRENHGCRRRQKFGKGKNESHKFRSHTGRKIRNWVIGHGMGENGKKTGKEKGN